MISRIKEGDLIHGQPQVFVLTLPGPGLGYIECNKTEKWHIYINIYIYIYIYIYNRSICPMGSVFANGQGDCSSIPGQVISKTQKMILDDSLLNTQHYKVRIKGKVEQSRERSTIHSYTLV